MANDLRKVKFYVERPNGFIPDYEGSRKKENDETRKERDGYFHCWIKEERKSEFSGEFREETLALIEEALTGKLFHVDYDLFRFVGLW